MFTKSYRNFCTALATKLNQSGRILTHGNEVTNEQFLRCVALNKSGPFDKTAKALYKRISFLCGNLAFDSFREFGYPGTHHDVSAARLNAHGEGISLFNPQIMFENEKEQIEIGASCRLNGLLYICEKNSKIPENLSIVRNFKSNQSSQRIITNETKMSINEFNDKLMQFEKENWHYFIKIPCKMNEKERLAESDNNNNNNNVAFVPKLLNGYTHARNVNVFDDKDCIKMNSNLQMDIDNINKEKIESTKIFFTKLLERNRNAFHSIMVSNENVLNEKMKQLWKDEKIDEMVNEMVNNNNTSNIVVKIGCKLEIPRDIVLLIKEENYQLPLPIIDNKQWIFYMVGFRGLERLLQNAIDNLDNNDNISAMETAIELAYKIDQLYPRLMVFLKAVALLQGENKIQQQAQQLQEPFTNKVNDFGLNKLAKELNLMENEEMVQRCIGNLRQAIFLCQILHFVENGESLHEQDIELSVKSRQLLARGVKGAIQDACQSLRLDMRQYERKMSSKQFEFTQMICDITQDLNTINFPL